MPSERFEHGGEVVGKRLLEPELATGLRMNEPELRGVEHDARNVDRKRARCHRRCPWASTNVDALTHERMTRLGEVNSNLVCAPCFELAANERRVIEAFERFDVRDRDLPLIRIARRASKAIAPIRHEPSSNRCRVDVPVGQREVATVNGVISKLLREISFRFERTCEHEHAGRVFVEAVYDAERALHGATSRST